MRLEHHIVHAEQHFRHLRFIGEHIQARAAQLARGQRLHQRIFIHHRTARHIHQNARRAQRLDHALLMIFWVWGVEGIITIRKSLFLASSTRSG
jgi:predicted ATPase